MNLLENVQKNLGYEPLKKVDPNTQEIKEAGEMTAEQKLAQAAIPAVLAALIKYSDSPEGINIINGDDANCLSRIYQEKENYAIKQIADYAGVPEDEARNHMGKICGEAMAVVRQ